MATKLLTKEQWDKVLPPFYHVELKNVAFRAVHYEIIKKWLEAHCGAGFIYWDEQTTYIFGSNTDLIAFKIWIMSDPFDGDGIIE